MAPKEESYFAPLNVVLARSSIKRISVAPTVEATRSRNLVVAEHIAQGFETVVILDDDGKTVSGILKSEDDKSLTLMDPQGALIRLDKDSIDERKKGLSSMPVDLLKYLNKRELRDLVAYLATLDGSPAAVAGPNEPRGGHRLE